MSRQFAYNRFGNSVDTARAFVVWFRYLLLTVVLFGTAVHAKAPPANTQLGGAVRLAQLPVQAQQTYALITQGGPFPYDKDGTVFGNRERLLPKHARGHYREYTVKTPGARNRGARRIVCGGPVKTPEVCYYTADHYGSFQPITP
jgi:ribonuclease T1